MFQVVTCERLRTNGNVKLLTDCSMGSWYEGWLLMGGSRLAGYGLTRWFDCILP